jgi:hypothetical protein
VLIGEWTAGSSFLFCASGLPHNMQRTCTLARAHCILLLSDMLPPQPWLPAAGRNDIAASMAAAEQEERPAEAAVSSIVSTPLGKMAKTTSPTKKPAHHTRQPATPSGERLLQPGLLCF